MRSEYVEQRDGGYYVAGIRVSLDSVVYAYKRGQSPEAIQEDFPILKLSQIYGAIAFYLDHETEIDKYLEDSQREIDANSIPLSVASPTFWEKIQEYKAQARERRS